MKSAAAVSAAIEAGADAIGMILVPGRKRTVSPEAALEISKVVHQTSKPDRGQPISARMPKNMAKGYFEHSVYDLYHPKRALLVGVFQNQPLEYVLAQQRILDLDVVQFHGSEPVEWARLVPVAVVRVFKPNEPGLGIRNYHTLPMLDSGDGGSGERLDLAEVKKVFEKDDELRVLLAGGLTPDNVASVLKELGPSRKYVVGVDVSGGVEENGEKSIKKIQDFIAAARSAV